MLRRSLRWRLMLGAAVSILVAMLLAGALLTVLFQRHVEHWLDAELQSHLDQLVAGVGIGTGGQLEMLKPPSDARFQQPLSGLYWQVSQMPSGAVLRSRSLWDFQLDIPVEPRAGEAVHHYRVTGPGGSRLYLLQRKVRLAEPGGDRIVEAAVDIDASELQAAVWRFASILVPFLLLIGALLTGAALAQISIGLRPLAVLRRRLSAIRAGEAAELGGSFPEEVQPLASEIDSLLEAQGRQLEKARGAAADLAHGLKTSLQLITIEAANLRRRGDDSTAGAIEALAGDMQRHVQRHLARARLAPKSARARADLAATADKLVGVVRRTPQGARLAWRLEFTPGLAARIDPQDLSEALGNLLENAARYAQSTVTVSGERRGGRILVSVTDDGPGIPAADRAKILKRGERLDMASGGSGLGFAIASDIVEAWGGSIRLDDAAPGLAVTLELDPPAAG